MHSVFSPPLVFLMAKSLIQVPQSLPNFASQFQPNLLDHNSLFSVFVCEEGGFVIMTNGLVSITTYPIAGSY